jgi:F420-dependent oxidoreductase-like protein
MRFGLFTSMGGTTWNELRALVEHADRTGWDAACVTDHFMPNTPDRAGDTLECWTGLAALAVVTRRIRIGTIVSGNTYRHPALVAKMAANVDIISGGRLICGMGAGWQENEHRAYGMDFYTVGERLARLDEACRVLKALWTQDRASFAGRFYRLDDAPLMPKPVQRPHPELMIGGGGEKVTLRIAAEHADHWNVWGGPETLRKKCEILDEHCARLGRDPGRILRSANVPLVVTDARAEVDRVERAYTNRLGGDADKARDTVAGGSAADVVAKLERLREAGVDMLWVPSFFLPAGAQRLAAMDRIMAEVAPALR